MFTSLILKLSILRDMICSKAPKAVIEAEAISWQGSFLCTMMPFPNNFYLSQTRFDLSFETLVIWKFEQYDIDVPSAYCAWITVFPMTQRETAIKEPHNLTEGAGKYTNNFNTR